MVLVLLLAVVLFFIIARRSRSPFAREQQQSGGGLGGRAFVRAPDRGGGLFARACLLVLGWARAMVQARVRQRSEPAHASGARVRKRVERARGGCVSVQPPARKRMWQNTAMRVSATLDPRVWDGIPP